MSFDINDDDISNAANKYLFEYNNGLIYQYKFNSGLYYLLAVAMKNNYYYSFIQNIVDIFHRYLFQIYYTEYNIIIKEWMIII